MRSLLFLCHRVPFPPDKGDKIRSFHILEALRSRYRVHLGTFVDTPEDWVHVEELRARTASLCVRSLPRYRSTLRSMLGFLSGEALTLPYYRDRGLARWVRGVIRDENPVGALVYSSGMAQYVTQAQLPVKVMDFCDLDSDKWAQYALTKSWPWRSVYRREARLLARAERSIAQAFDYSVFVSQLESELFCSRNPGLDTRVKTLGNGVDTRYFDPAQVQPVKEQGGPHVMFTGAMDYWANVDAVRWFVQEVWPSVLVRHPQARFFIVGSKPAPEVQALATERGVTVTGRVPDVRPWLLAASVVVAPLRIARGVQNKVLEAMAMSRPIVATGAALQGIGSVPSEDVSRADTAAEFADSVSRRLDVSASARAAEGNRRFVIERFGWPTALQSLWPLLDGAA